MKPLRQHRAFTLLELLISISIVVLLGSLSYAASRRVKAKAAQVACIGNLRSIHVAILAQGMDNEGVVYSDEQIGSSAYRGTNDSYGLPTLLKPYGVSDRAWICPAGRPDLKRFGNNYAWSRNNTLTSRSLQTLSTLKGYALVFDNYAYTLPSVPNVPEPPPGGPKQPPSSYRYYPHGKTRYDPRFNFLYADGRVELQ